jgi:hypothetical protein
VVELRLGAGDVCVAGLERPPGPTAPAGRLAMAAVDAYKASSSAAFCCPRLIFRILSIVVEVVAFVIQVAIRSLYKETDRCVPVAVHMYSE